MLGYLIGKAPAPTISRLLRSLRSARTFCTGIASYYLSRLIINPIIRQSIVAVLRKYVGKSSAIHEDTHALFKALNNDGIVKITNSLSESQCDDIATFLAEKLLHDQCHSVKKKISDIHPGDMSIGFHRIDDVLHCPHIIEFVSSPQVVQLATAYLGCTPTLSGIVVQWSFPSSRPSVAQKFHRDREDWKFLRFFIYLSDVDEGCGPHVFIKGTHREKLTLRLRFYEEQEILQHYGAENYIKVLGKRGTGIIADTCGIHKGEVPTVKPRLMLSFTYSILPNPFLRYQPIHSRHPHSFKNYTNRLFLR